MIRSVLESRNRSANSIDIGSKLARVTIEDTTQRGLPFLYGDTTTNRFRSDHQATVGVLCFTLMHDDMKLRHR